MKYFKPGYSGGTSVTLIDRSKSLISAELSFPQRIAIYFQLTKPSIMLLVLFSGATGLILEGTFLYQPLKLLGFLIGLFLTGGSANSLNQYLERDIDALMTRTNNRRPLPKNQISPREALIFSISIGVIGVVLLLVWFNAITALLALGTILFYGLFYTLWLKPHTSQNIVIGGIAGAMAPVGAYAAASGRFPLEFAPWFIFAVIFLWTPPHFWSLALKFDKDYALTPWPMYSREKGLEKTLRSIFVYTLILTVFSLTYFYAGGGWLYLSGAVLLGIAFLYKVTKTMQSKLDSDIWAVFKFSIIYLFGLLSVMLIDKFLAGIS